MKTDIISPISTLKKKKSCQKGIKCGIMEIRGREIIWQIRKR